MQMILFQKTENNKGGIKEQVTGILTVGTPFLRYFPLQPQEMQHLSLYLPPQLCLWTLTVFSGEAEVHLHLLQLHLRYPLFQVWTIYWRDQSQARLSFRSTPPLSTLKSPSHSQSDLSVLGRLRCQCKLEEKNLVFRLGSLHPSGININFSNFK